MMDNGLVYIIVLNWNGRGLLQDCLSSLESVKYENNKVLLVDNGSSDDSVGLVRSEFPKVDILELDQNYGFAKGNNIGFENTIKNDAEYVIFLNNDTMVEPDFIEPLISPLVDETIGQTVPKIFYADDREKIWYAGGRINLWTGNIFHEGIRQKDCEQFRSSKNTDYATGCCFAMRTNDFAELKGFDESFSMYGEDADLSMRVRSNGQKILFIPNSKIYHKVSASIGGAFSFRKMKRKGAANLKLMFKYAQPYQWLTQLVSLPFLAIGGIIKYFRYK